MQVSPTFTTKDVMPTCDLYYGSSRIGNAKQNDWNLAQAAASLALCRPRKGRHLRTKHVREKGVDRRLADSSIPAKYSGEPNFPVGFDWRNQAPQQGFVGGEKGCWLVIHRLGQVRR